jgi:hypothetical protein
MSSHERYKAYVNKPNESFDYPNMTWEDWQAAYRAGQAEMRERAAEQCRQVAWSHTYKGMGLELNASKCERLIRALPIEERT